MLCLIEKGTIFNCVAVQKNLAVPPLLHSILNFEVCQFLLVYKNIFKAFKMMALVNRFLDWIKSLFWKEEMELTLVGLQYSGKTTFVNVIAVSRFTINVTHWMLRV